MGVVHHREFAGFQRVHAEVMRDHEIALDREHETETLECFFLFDFVLARDDGAIGVDARDGQRTERGDFRGGAITFLVERIHFDTERLCIQRVKVIGVGLVENFDVGIKFHRICRSDFLFCGRINDALCCGPRASKERRKNEKTES
jgi:hypothetical protein